MRTHTRDNALDDAEVWEFRRLVATKSGEIYLTPPCSDAARGPSLNMLAYATSPLSYTTLDTETAYERWSAGAFALVLDVRTEAEYEQSGPESYEGHLPGAYLVDSLASIGEPGIPEGVWSCRNCSVAVYCRTGVRSQGAAQVLDSVGFSDVYDIGGVSQWGSAGYPVVQGEWAEPEGPLCPSDGSCHAPLPPPPLPAMPLPLPAMPSPSPPPSAPPSACPCDTYVVSGAEDVHPAAMGAYIIDRTQFAAGDRPVFRHPVSGVFLFFWAPQYDWHIGLEVCADTGARCNNLLAHGTRDAFSLCPSSNEDTWVHWVGYGWSATPSLTVECPSPPPVPPDAPPPPAPPPSPAGPPPALPSESAVSYGAVIGALVACVVALTLLAAGLCMRLRWQQRKLQEERSTRTPEAGAVAVAVPLATVTNVLEAGDVGVSLSGVATGVAVSAGADEGSTSSPVGVPVGAGDEVEEVPPETDEVGRAVAAAAAQG